MMKNHFGVVDNVVANMRNRMGEDFVSVLYFYYTYLAFICPTVTFFIIVSVYVFQENMSTDLNSHSFSSSSVMTYSKVGNEPAKVFQACSSTRRAPGGVSEYRI